MAISVCYSEFSGRIDGAKMSSGYFDSAESDCLYTYPGNIAMNRDDLSTGIPPGQSLCMQIQYRYYTCGACGEKMLESQLVQHHSKLHGEVPFIMDMYELFEIDERIKCRECDIEITDSFDKHMALTHPQILLDSTNQNYPTYDASVNECEPNDNWQSEINERPNPVFCLCTLCNASVMKPHKRRHHRLTHPEVSAHVNIYESAEVIEKVN